MPTRSSRKCALSASDTSWPGVSRLGGDRIRLFHKDFARQRPAVCTRAPAFAPKVPSISCVGSSISVIFRHFYPSPPEAPMLAEDPYRTLGRKFADERDDVVAARATGCKIRCRRGPGRVAGRGRVVDGPRRGAGDVRGLRPDHPGPSPVGRGDWDPDDGQCRGCSRDAPPPWRPGPRPAAGFTSGRPSHQPQLRLGAHPGQRCSTTGGSTAGIWPRRSVNRSRWCVVASVC